MKLIFIMIMLTGFLYTQDLHLKKGMDAPDFTLKDQNSSVHTLSDYTGKSPVVIYFYPKAGSSGCTKQACGIRDSYKKFDEHQFLYSE